MTPLISVVVPVYNAEKYLEKCLDSVLQQGIRDLEIICVDDGSTDGSPELLARFAARDPRVRVVQQPNASAGAARNHGMRYAAGTYLHFLDADDWLERGIYVRAIARLEQSGADVCAFQYRSFHDAAGRTHRCPCLPDGKERVVSLETEPALLLYNAVVPWNKIYRREWIEEHSLRFDELTCANDRAFYFRLLTSGARVCMSKEYGVYYREKNAGSLTGSIRFRQYSCLFRAYESAAESMREQPQAVQAMFLDATVSDLLSVFYQAPLEEKQRIYGLLHNYLKTMDISAIRALPFPCAWLNTYRALRDNPAYTDISPGLTDKLRKIRAGFAVWGVRGRCVKYLSAIEARISSIK